MTAAWRDGIDGSNGQTVFTIPGTVQSGDYVVLAATQFDSGTPSGAVGGSWTTNGASTPAAISGADTGAFNGYPGTTDRLTAWGFTAAAGDLGKTLTFSQADGNASLKIVLAAYSSTAGVDVAAAANTSPPGTTPSPWTGAPAVTSTVAGDLAIFIATDFNGSDAETFTPGAGTATLRLGFGSRLALCDSGGSIGGAGTSAGAGSWAGTFAPWGGLTILLKPAGGPPAAPPSMLLAGMV